MNSYLDPTIRYDIDRQLKGCLGGKPAGASAEAKAKPAGATA
jgi:hypothetical protein